MISSIEKLWEAIRSDDILHASILLRGQQTNSDLDCVNKYGETCLMYAAKIGKSDIIEILLDLGASIQPQNIWGCTALHIAAIHGRQHIVKKLLEYGSNVNAQDNKGWTALHSAVYGEHLNVVHVLLDGNADVTLLNLVGESALDIARISRTSTPIIKILMQHMYGIQHA